MMIIKVVRGITVLTSVVLLSLWICSLFHVNIGVLEKIIYFTKMIHVIFINPTNPEFYPLILLTLILIIGIVVITLSFLFSIPGDIIFALTILVCLSSILLIKSDTINVLVFNGHRYDSFELLNYHVVKYDYIYLTALILMFIFKKYLDKLYATSNKLNDIMAEEFLLKCLITGGLFFAILFFVFIGWMIILTNMNITCRTNMGILLIIISIILLGTSLFLYKKEE